MADDAVSTVAQLREGESYCRTIFIPSYDVTPDRIRAAKLKLKRDLSPVIARAKKQVSAEFHMHTIHSFTGTYDVVVVAIIVRESAL